jgi:hypothetical protein
MMQLSDEESQNTGVIITHPGRCSEFNRKLNSKYVSLLLMCFAIGVIFCLTLTISYSRAMSILANYQANDFKVNNYTLNLSICDLDSGSVTCYLGYIDMNYQDANCQKYIAKSLVDKNELLAYLMQSYPIGTVVNIHHKGDDCKYDFDDKMKTYNGGLIAGIVFGCLAFIVFWPCIYYYLKA